MGESHTSPIVPSSGFLHEIRQCLYLHKPFPNYALDSVLELLIQEVIAEPNWWEWVVSFLIDQEVPGGIIILAISGFSAFIGNLVIKWWSGRKRKAAEDYIANYSDDEIANYTENYVRTDCFVPAKDKSRPEHFTQEDRQELFGVVDQFIRPDAKKTKAERGYRFMFILADSGMGKTAFVLNYFEKRFKKHRLVVVRVGVKEDEAVEKVDNFIRSIENPRQTVIILDGLDEDSLAQDDLEKRFNELDDLTSEFYRVIITCRRQFFVEEKLIPKKESPKGYEANYQILKLYLAPFTMKQVDRFLKSAFPGIRNRKLRKRARSLVDRIDDLYNRPLILTYIELLLEKEDEDYSKRVDIYRVIIDEWIKRDSSKVFGTDEQHMLFMMKYIAAQMQLEGMQDGMDHAYFDSFAKLQNIEISKKELTSRSLLTRDGADRYKFAHRSIMEYLFVLALLEDPKQYADVPLSDEMQVFLTELLASPISDNRFRTGISPVDPLLRNTPDKTTTITPEITGHRFRTYFSQSIEAVPKLVLIPAGVFLMGSYDNDKDARNNEKPKHQVELSEYAIGKHPITNREYEAFVKETNYRAPKQWKKGTYPSGKADHPVTHVTWNDVKAYCEWMSKKTGWRFGLPTEAQWEKAARGSDGRIYPWGDEWKKENCNNYESGIEETTPVGLYSLRGDSPNGCADMVGNVWEWCEDSYDKDAYKSRKDQDIKDPVVDNQGHKNRVFRGGSFGNARNRCRCAVRGGDFPGSYDFIGFRIVLLP